MPGPDKPKFGGLPKPEDVKPMQRRKRHDSDDDNDDHDDFYSRDKEEAK